MASVGAIDTGLPLWLASLINAVVMLSGNGEIAVRLGAALLLGSALGLNRELHGKPAGLRTHGLVSLGAAVAALVSCGFPGSNALDPNAVSRVLQGILTGIGFLGAGVILRDPSGHVTGLTTAATIWICAVLGVACGLGYWSVLGIAVGLTAFALILGKPIEHFAERLFKRKRSTPPDPSV
jgi:putative Mg2+ transporter-C (MgtC) family protein